jgi:hypothetical protein
MLRRRAQLTSVHQQVVREVEVVVQELPKAESIHLTHGRDVKLRCVGLGTINQCTFSPL